MEKNEIEKMLKDHEERLKKIESFFTKKETPKITDDYSGLNGGIRLLIKNDFLDKPKSLKEIQNELKRENYHYSISAVAKALSVYFTKNKKILTRFKEGKIWKYVVRK